MGWVIVVLMVVIAVLALWRFARLPKGGLELVLAAGFVAIAGYAWQANPSMPGVSIESREQSVPPDTAAVMTRRMMTNNYGDAAKVAEFADTLDRLGLTREAIIAVKTGIRKQPDDPELWVSLGNTLVAHGGGMLSPAAEYAYQHAAQLSPEHPGPPFFMGLALANSGRTAEAGQVWRGLLARSPKDAAWRGDLEARLSSINELPAAPTP